MHTLRRQFTHPGTLLLYLPAIFVLEIMVLCSKSISRQVPWNYIVLFSFTICMSLAVGQSLSFVVVQLDKDGGFVINSDIQHIILLAGFLTTITAVSLTAYAYSQTSKLTIPGCLASLLIGQLCCLIFSLIFFNYIGFFYILLCCLSAVGAGLYFIYHTMLVRGVFNVRIDYNDYIRGALLLYIDLIDIFLKILRILLIIYGKHKK